MDAFLYPTASFISLPFFMHHLSKVDFGFWMLMNTLVILFQFVHLGLPVSAMKKVASNWNNHEVITRELQSHLSVGLLVLLVAVFLGPVTFLIMNSTGRAIEQMDNHAIAFICFVFAAFWSGLKLFEQIFLNFFKSFEHYHTSFIYSTIVRYSTLGLNLILVLSGFRTLSMLISSCLISILGLCLMYKNVQNLINEFHFRWYFSKIIFKEQFSFSIFIWLQSVLSIITFQFDRILIASKYGVAMVGNYAVIAVIFNHIRISLCALGLRLMPRASMLYSSHNEHSHLFFQFRTFISSISVVVLIVVFLALQFILPHFFNIEKSAEMLSYVRPFLIYESFYQLSIVPYFYFNSIGKERSQTFFVLIFAVFNLMGMIGGCFLFNQVVFIIWGLGISAMIIMPVLHLYIQLKMDIYDKTKVKDLLLLLLPLFLFFIVIINTNTYVSIILLMAMLVLIINNMKPILKMNFTNEISIIGKNQPG